MDQSLVSVMKSIGQALRLDSDNNYQEAYIKYAECILNIVSNLLHEVKTDAGKVNVSKEVVRHIQLGQQCMDRLAALVQTLVSVQNAAANLHIESSQSNQMAVPRLGPSSQLAKRFSQPVPPLNPDTSPYAFSRKHGPSPMELAYIRNQQIMSAYKSRLARMNKGSQATQLSLTIQRKMAENLAIAKAQEEALAKKMNERQNRLEQEAKRRFTAPMGMSEDEQEQRQIYKKILEYEQDAKWLANPRQKLERSPEDPIVINQLIQEILRCSDHPLTQLLKKYQYKIYERLYPIVFTKMKQLKDITVPLPDYLHPVDDPLKLLDSGKTVEPAAETGRETEQQNSNQKFEKDDPDENDVANLESCSPKPDDINVVNDNVEKNHENVDSEIDEKKIDVETESKDEDANKIPKINSESSLNTADDVSESEIAKIIHDVASGPQDKDDDDDDDDNNDDDDESSLKNMDELVGQSQDNLNSAIVKGKKLEKQLTIENETANMVIQRISEYEKYNEENMDDLFDDEDDDNDGDNDMPESERGVSSKDSVGKPSSYDSMPSMRSLPSDNISRGQIRSEGDASIPPVGNIPKSHSMDSGPMSLPSFPSSDSSSLTSSRSVDSIPDDKLSKMSEEAYKRHLNGISQDVHSYLEKLLLMFTIAYESLDSPTGRDQCYASLEEPFFKPIWKYILALFRLANKGKEKILAYKMTTKQNSEPKDFLVAKKLWLGSADEENWRPYNKAVIELKKVKEYYTMLSKLECVVRVCREVCTCVDDYYTSEDCKTERKKSPPSVYGDLFDCHKCMLFKKNDPTRENGPYRCQDKFGADDLLPILSYIVVKSELPQLVSECQAMAEFIHEGYIMGEEGYCLTSLQTAVNFLTT